MIELIGIMWTTAAIVPAVALFYLTTKPVCNCRPDIPRAIAIRPTDVTWARFAVRR